MYLKMAMLRDGSRPEPYYWLSELCENRGNVREAFTITSEPSMWDPPTSPRARLSTA